MLYIKRNILFYHIHLNCKTFLSFLFLQSPPKCLEIRGLLIYDGPSNAELPAEQASDCGFGICLLLKHQQSKLSIDLDLEQQTKTDLPHET